MFKYIHFFFLNGWLSPWSIPKSFCTKTQASIFRDEQIYDNHAKKKEGVKFHSCGMIYDIEVKGRKKGERERGREKFTALFNGHGGRQY